METKNETVDPLKGMTKEQRAELLARLQTEAKNDRMAKRESYEALRGQFMHDVLGRVENLESEVSGFKKWLDDEVTAFTKLMREYGAVKNESQQSYTITDGDFKLEVKFNKVKGFDERADLAAERLVDYLKRYMEASEKGVEDPMYQMAMTLLERWTTRASRSFMSWRTALTRSMQKSCVCSRKPMWCRPRRRTTTSLSAIRRTVCGAA